MNPQTASKIYKLLAGAYPDALIENRHNLSPFESLIVTILSAQTTDRSVDEVSGPLFARFPTPGTLAAADLPELEEIIHRTGFYRMKARRIKDAASMLIQEFNGSVPATMEELLRIPGVGRKTANIVLFHAFGKNEGIAVDTHVLRLSRLIGFSLGSDPAIVERDLVDLFPQDHWGRITDLLISHGRRTCIARRPRCAGCVIRKYCRYYGEVVKAGKT